MCLHVCPAAEPESPWSSEAETSTLGEVSGRRKGAQSGRAGEQGGEGRSVHQATQEQGGLMPCPISQPLCSLHCRGLFLR